MCGIAGVINYTSEELLPKERWTKFADPLKYRGPDDRGDWHYTSDKVTVSLFHTRLSIIDLDNTGHQPMTTTDGNMAIIFNGEIYNYKQLKEELSNKGFSFQSTSDTEVLLLGYRCWGIETLLSKIDGMFAFVLFDKVSEKVWLVRDRFGKKPLYYSILNGSIIFSSDIRSFYQIPSLSLTINLHSLGYFFYELSTPETESIWSQIKKIPSSHFATFDKKGFVLHKYWSLTFSNTNKLSRPDTISKTYDLLLQATKKRLVADVPVAALLSGGIDSSLVVAMMASLSPNPVRTYTVTFDQPGLDESKYAKLVADRFGTQHTEIRLSDLDNKLSDFVICEYGEPFADTSMLPTYVICNEIAKSEKVVCGGDGGDELFGGYHINYFVNKLEKVKNFRSLFSLVSKLSNHFPNYRVGLLKDLLQAANESYYKLLHRKMGFNQKEIEVIFNNDTITQAADREHELIWGQFSVPSNTLSSNIISSFIHTRLVNDYLVKVDRASMMASLEMRSPFLDKDLAQFAATFKNEELYNKNGTKPILKSIAEKFFPKDFVHRHKMGFGAPVADWLRNEWGEKFREVVFAKQSLVEINYSVVEDLFKRHLKGEDHTEKLWAMYVFHVWANDVKAARQ